MPRTGVIVRLLQRLCLFSSKAKPANWRSRALLLLLILLLSRSLWLFPKVSDGVIFRRGPLVLALAQLELAYYCYNSTAARVLFWRKVGALFAASMAVATRGRRMENAWK